MGLMETLRSSTKYIVIVLIISFGLIWVLADVDFFGAMQAGPNKLGEVNGEDISLEEYQSRLQYYSNLYVQQSGGSMSPEITAIYERQVWDELVTSRLIEQKMDELGITVTDNELLDMVYGENPDPFIVQNFSRQDGSIDRAYIDQILTNPDFSQQAIAIDLQLRQKRRQEKLSNFITAGLQVTNQEIEEEYIKNNSFADVSYIRFPFSEIDESEITVSDKDLRDYYNANKEEYKQEESYRASYVTFSFLPTAEDTTEIIAEVEALRADFATAEDDSLFLVRRQSTTPYSAAYINKSDVRDEYKAVLEIEEGEVTEPFINAGQVSVIKKVDERRNDVKFVVYSQIIEALPSTIRKADSDARDFQLFATEETDFETEAENAGLEIKSSFATKDNPFISGLGSSQQVLSFLEKADEGDVSPVYELGSEFVVVKLDEKTEAGFRPFDEVKSQIENIVKLEKRKALTAEKVTNMLAGNADLAALATASGKEITEASGVAANAVVMPEAGREPKVIGAVFALEEGQTSKAITGSTGVFVVQVTSKSMASVENMDATTAEQIRQRLEQQKNQKFVSIWLEELKENADIVDNRKFFSQG